MEIDIIIPVYNEGEYIVPVLRSLKEQVKTPFRVLICYDHEEDSTLKAIDKADDSGLDILRVKNTGKGAHGAVLTGFKKSSAPAVLVFPADDTFNAEIIDDMFRQFIEGSDIVAASRFIEGGCMEGAPFMKDLLVRTSSWALHYLAGVPSHDASNGFRLFSRRVIEEIPIESNEGFVYSIELLVKCHRLGWRISEVPAKWIERTAGKSRFRLGKWLPSYLKWFFYGFETRYFKIKADNTADE